MKKNLLWIVVAIILIIAAFFLGAKGCSGVDEINKEWKDSLAKIQSQHFEKIQIARAEIALLTAKLDTCENGLVRPLTMEEQLQAVKDELRALKRQPRAVTRTRTLARPDVAERSVSATFTPAPQSERVVTASVSLSGVEFEGDTSGDLGTTITPERRLVYFLKHYSSIIGTPLVNGIHKMTLDADGYWYYIDPRILSEEEIINGFFTWNVRINDVNWGAGKYDAWLPHETLKPLINDIRGFEYGMITNDDLNKMSQRDSRVWSPNNPNGIFQPLPGISKARNDNTFWHGWNFRTKINYKRVTK